MNETLQADPQWEKIDTNSIKGTVLVVGGIGSGKSTFSRWLYERLCRAGVRTALIDGDPGQSTLGPPCTMTMVIGDSESAEFPPPGKRHRSFVGAVSPIGHMLQMLAGAERLVRKARHEGAETIVYDTTGLIHPERGGVNLKLVKVSLLRTETVVSIQRKSELEPLLGPMRRSKRARLIELSPSEKVRPRNSEARRRRRAQQFAEYFERSSELTVAWKDYAVIPSLTLSANRLVGLEDRFGFVLGLGIVRGIGYGSCKMTLFSPLSSLEGVDTLHVGNVEVDVESFQDRKTKPRA